jgi:site-specific DNA-methyltransferase (adenine-specific)
MKFDVIVGNPPYQSGNDSKGNKLWPKFINKSNSLINEGGYLAMIVPSSWTTGGNNTPDRIGILRDIFSKNYVVKVNVTSALSNYFPQIGIKFSWFVMAKGAAPKNTIIESDSGKVCVNFEKISFLPTDISNLSLNVYKKLFSRDSFDVVSFDRQKADHKSPVKTKECQVKHWVLGTGKDAQYCYLPFDKTPEFSQYRKVVFPLRKFSNVDMIHIDTTGVAICQQGFYINIGDATVENVKSVWYSKLFRFLTYGVHPAGFLKINVIHHLPKVSYDRVWTDKELYEHFGLTQDEIDYIEANVK